MGQDADRSVLVVAPELCATGGIQSFGADVLHALRALCPPEKLTVVSRNDSTAELQQRFPWLRDPMGLECRHSRLQKLFVRHHLRRVIRRVRPDVILCLHPHLVPAVVRRGVPVIAFCYGVDIWNVSPRVARSLRHITRMLSISKFTSDRLVEQLPELESRIALFPPAYDDERFVPVSRNPAVRERLGIPAEARVVLTVARLAKSEGPKGYDDVVRSLPLLLKTHPDAWYVLAGKGADAERVKSLADELGVGSRVLLPGFVPDAELPDLYRAADVFIMPSRKEGFGIVFVEAAASGTAVIGGNADGSVDALLGGRSGRLVTPGDVSGIADALREEFNLDRESKQKIAAERAVLVRDAFGRPVFRERLRLHLQQCAACR